jgi:hypothetical protein
MPLYSQLNAGGREPEKSRKAQLLQARKEERREAARKRTAQRKRVEEAEQLKDKVDRAIDTSTSDLTGGGENAAGDALAAVRAMNTDYPETSRTPGVYTRAQQQTNEQYPETDRTEYSHYHNIDERAWAATQIQAVQRRRQGQKQFALAMQQQEEMLREEVKRELILEQEQALEEMQAAYRDLGHYTEGASKPPQQQVFQQSPVKDELMAEERAVLQIQRVTRGFFGRQYAIYFEAEQEDELRREIERELEGQMQAQLREQYNQKSDMQAGGGSVDENVMSPFSTGSTSSGRWLSAQTNAGPEERKEEDDDDEDEDEEGVGGRRPSRLLSPQQEVLSADSESFVRSNRGYVNTQSPVRSPARSAGGGSSSAASPQYVRSPLGSNSAASPQYVRSPLVSPNTPVLESGKFSRLWATHCSSPAADVEVLPPSFELHSDQTILDQVLEDGEINMLSVTWNLHAQTPDCSPSLSKLLPANRYHMYVIGTEECERSITASMIFQKKPAWEATLQDTLGGRYAMLRSHSLQAIHLTVYCHTALLGMVSDIECHAVATGIKNTLGNKGGIGIAMKMGLTSMLFINCHLAAGQSKVDDRNENARKIDRELFDSRKMPIASRAVNAAIRARRNAMSPGGVDGDEIPLTSGIDRVVWMGDLNYRNIGVKRHIADAYLAKCQVATLMKHDQLRQMMQEGTLFTHLVEGAIHFPPTYKLDAGTLTYDTGSKQRVPSWTDRILYARKGMKQTSYNCSRDVLISDHLPVYATFRVQFKPEPGGTTRARAGATQQYGQNTSQVCSIM